MGLGTSKEGIFLKNKKGGGVPSPLSSPSSSLSSCHCLRRPCCRHPARHVVVVVVVVEVVVEVVVVVVVAGSWWLRLMVVVVDQMWTSFG